MKYSKTNTKDKRLGLRKALLALIIVLFILGGAIIFYKSRSDNQQAISNQQQTEDIKFNDQNKADDNQNSNQANQPDAKTDTDSGGSNANQPTTGQSSASSITIDSLSQSDGKVNLSSTLSGAQSGQCAITFTAEDGSVLNKSINIESGKCNLSLSELEFSYIGNWSVTVSVGSVSDTKGIAIK